MSDRIVCPHCSFRNFSVSRHCARCEKPLTAPEDGKTTVAAFDSLGEPAAAPERMRPPAARASPGEQAAARSRRGPPAGPLLAGADPLLGGLPAAPPVPHAPVRHVANEPRGRPWAAPQSAPTAPLPGQSQQPAVSEAPRAAARREPATGSQPSPQPPRPLQPQVRAPQHSAELGHQRAAAAGQRPQLRPLLPPNRKGPQAQAPAARRSSDPRSLPQAAVLRHALAHLIDSGLIVAAFVAYASLEMAYRSGVWPTGQGTFLTSLAMWLHTYGGCARRSLLVALLFACVHALYGVRTGYTLGRRALGLLLVGLAGPQPTKGGTWSAASWHAIGGVLSVMSLGAGTLWLVVDHRRRTWANVLGKTMVVSNARRPTARS